MADCCQELRSELAALRAEIAKLQKVDEDSIIKKAVDRAEAKLNPSINQAFTTANNAATAAALAYKVGELASNKAFQALSSSRSAAVVADIAKKQAVNAASIGELASMRAGNAFNAANRAAAEAAIAKALGSTAQASAATANATAIRATGLAALAQATANAANAFAASAIGRTVLLAANILSLAGSIAGLFSLYATLKIVFPRLDEHDRQLAMHDSELSKQLSLITGQKFRIDALATETNKALLNAAFAQVVAERADNRSVEAINNAGTAINKSNSAINEATKATDKANIARDTANDSYTKSLAAIGEANIARDKAKRAQDVADESYTKSVGAIGLAELATDKANTATKKANESQRQADKALAAATKTIDEIATLKPKVDDAQREAYEARAVGLLGLRTAQHVEPIANQALSEVSQVRPISENALTNAYNALNRVNIVEPVANNAFTATQLQSNQLRNTQLEVTGLGKTTKIHDKKIIDLGTKIDDFKPPITTEPGEMSNKEVLEKLAQLTGAVGLIGLGINNIPKNIANSPELKNTITNATINANCRTAQPSGCTGRAINNGIQAGNDDLKKYLNGLLKAGNTALELDTNLKVTKVLADTQKIRTGTGSDRYPMVVPEYLLDDFIDTPKVITDQVGYNVWLLKQVDALVGLFPIKIERTDENGQKQMLIFENIAEAIAELTGLLAEIAFDADTSVNVGVHATSEAIGAKIAAIQGNSYLKSIVDYLGFQGSHKAINVPISCTPGAVGVDDKLQENELGDFLKSSTQRAIGWECTERDDLHSIIKRILFDSEIARAALYKPIKPPTSNKGQTMTGDAIKADRIKEKRREDDEWEKFKTRIKNQEGTGIDIDIDERPLNDGGNA